MNTLQTFREYLRSTTKFPTNTPKTPNLHPAKYQRTPPKYPTYTPPGVGADSSCPYFSFVKSVFSHYQIRIFISSQTDVHILKYVYSNHHTRISVPHFVGAYGYEGTINRSPTAANGLPQRY